MTGPRLALQERTDQELRALLRRPGHAFLFLGPPGSGKFEAARAFSAALLCADGGCGHCGACTAAAEGSHPDLAVVERSGPALSIDEVRSVASLALRAPIASERQVIVVRDVHLGRQVMPALLKTVEEPPASTVFVLLADGSGAELATLASRCSLVRFGRLESDWLRRTLRAEGVEPDRADLAAEASGGSLARARLLATDDDLAARREAWMSVPERLDGTGSTIASLARELAELTNRAMEPLKRHHGEQLRQHADRAKQFGADSVPPRKLLSDQQRREERRARTDELEAGLGALAEAYRDRITASVRAGAPNALAVEGAREASVCIGQAAKALARNPNESLLLQAMLVRLQRAMLVRPLQCS